MVFHVNCQPGLCKIHLLFIYASASGRDASNGTMTNEAGERHISKLGLASFTGVLWVFLSSDDSYLMPQALSSINKLLAM